MKIDVMPSKNPQAPGWVVIAHSPSGDIHDFGFNSQAEALEFVEAVYGIGKIVPVKQAPKTTPDRIAFYHTTRDHCSCSDHQLRGGSYFYGSKQVCKHRYQILAEDFALANRVADAWFQSKQEHISKEGVLAA